MRSTSALLLALSLSATAAAVTVVVEERPSGDAWRCAPLSVEVAVPDELEKNAARNHVALKLGTGGKPIPAQVQPMPAGAAFCPLLWFMPEGGPAGEYILVSNPDNPSAVAMQFNDETGQIDFLESARPFFRFDHGKTQVPAGTDPKYQRGNYVSALWGPYGELLTEDYPADHPHHRALNWSWATVQWRGEARDLFAVSGIWARPSRFALASGGPVAGVIDAESQWMWDDKDPVVRERVLMRAYRATEDGRYIDFEIQLTALVDDLEFAGRLDAGYSGFNLRMAPGQDQQIRLHNDDEGAVPRRSWGDYSAVFEGVEGPSGIAIFQNTQNPAYPSEWREYPPLNFFQPAYPGGALIPMPKGEAITLRYRLWIHKGVPTEEQLAERWTVYNEAAPIRTADGEEQP